MEFTSRAGNTFARKVSQLPFAKLSGNFTVLQREVSVFAKAKPGAECKPLTVRVDEFR